MEVFLQLVYCVQMQAAPDIFIINISGTWLAETRELYVKTMSYTGLLTRVVYGVYVFQLRIPA